MKNYLIFCCVVSCMIAIRHVCGEQLLFKPQTHQEENKLPRPRTYIVDLDLPEEKRWNHVVDDFSDGIKELENQMKVYVPEEVLPLIEKVAADIDQYLPKPYAGEIKGIANRLNVNLGDIVVANIIYELVTFCTSIVAQDSKGQIWHARNLDYGLHSGLKNVTILVHFQRNKKTVYSSVMYAGYVGALSGQKPHGFTITIDSREKGAWWMNALMAILERKAAFTSFLIRDTLEKETTFKAAVERISSTPTIASAYYIMAGVKPGEGTVITKDRLSVVDTWYINTNQSRWFIVETNYDHWVAPPTSDDRRNPAIKAMNAVGQDKVSLTSLFKVMSTHPVLNPTTTYTVIMSAAQPDLMETWIRMDAQYTQHSLL